MVYLKLDACLRASLKRRPFQIGQVKTDATLSQVVENKARPHVKTRGN